MNNEKEPIFIIGAGRSGTNILRDVLTKLPNMITWPCDEINLVFRHGNRNLPHDEFDKSHINKEAGNYITETFSKLIKSSGNSNSIVVEKTCANSLRIPFLNELFPEAKYIFIYRNGYDVTASAVKRWQAPIEVKYLSKKLSFVPKSDIPFYAVKFFRNRLYQMFSNEKKQKQWGPVYKGMGK
ncbi:MAG: sulfotransferase, partial [Bacteroidetes bacterium]